MQPRPPVVTILGHVDHGKTTLLDFIRKSHLAAKEHGGITQRIGAYEISTGIKGYKTDKITFIDTPGHEAFSLLRARGANVADLAILIIDAKDSIMPQTIESISHIKAAKIPFIVAINKVDLPEANPEKVKRELLKYDVQVEEQGGKVFALPISAKTGKGVDELLESILLITADLHLQYDPQGPLKAYIIETKKGKQGILVATIIKDGSLKIGETVFVDSIKTKVRSLINDLGQQINQIFPSTPTEILGFDEMPNVGSEISKLPPQAKAEIAASASGPKAIDMESFLHPKEEEKKLSLIIKADSQGTLEAIANSLVKKDNVEVILKGIGEIHKSDIFLAKTTKAIVIGFAVGMTPEVRDLAKQEQIIVKTYNVIYELLEELNEVARLLKEKEEREKNVKGEAKVLATFVIEGEKIFGIKMTKGKANLGDEIELYRKNKLIGKTKIVSLRIRAKTVQEVKKDQDAGIIFSPPLDIKVGDVIQYVL